MKFHSLVHITDKLDHVPKLCLHLCLPPEPGSSSSSNGTSLGSCAYLTRSRGQEAGNSSYVEDVPSRNRLNLFLCGICVPSLVSPAVPNSRTDNSSAIFSGAGRCVQPRSQGGTPHQRLQKGRIS